MYKICVDNVLVKFEGGCPPKPIGTAAVRLLGLDKNTAIQGEWDWVLSDCVG